MGSPLIEYCNKEISKFLTQIDFTSYTKFNLLVKTDSLLKRGEHIDAITKTATDYNCFSPFFGFILLSSLLILLLAHAIIILNQLYLFAKKYQLKRELGKDVEKKVTTSYELCKEINKYEVLEECQYTQLWQCMTRFPFRIFLLFLNFFKMLADVLYFYNALYPTFVEKYVVSISEDFIERQETSDVLAYLGLIKKGKGTQNQDLNFVVGDDYEGSAISNLTTAIELEDLEPLFPIATIRPETQAQHNEHSTKFTKEVPPHIFIIPTHIALLIILTEICYLYLCHISAHDWFTENYNELQTHSDKVKFMHFSHSGNIYFYKTILISLISVIQYIYIDRQTFYPHGGFLVLLIAVLVFVTDFIRAVRYVALEQDIPVYETFGKRFLIRFWVPIVCSLGIRILFYIGGMFHDTNWAKHKKHQLPIFLQDQDHGWWPPMQESYNLTCPSMNWPKVNSLLWSYFLQEDRNLMLNEKSYWQFFDLCLFDYVVILGTINLGYFTCSLYAIIVYYWYTFTKMTKTFCVIFINLLILHGLTSLFIPYFIGISAWLLISHYKLHDRKMYLISFPFMKIYYKQKLNKNLDLNRQIMVDDEIYPFYYKKYWDQDNTGDFHKDKYKGIYGSPARTMGSKTHDRDWYSTRYLRWSYFLNKLRHADEIIVWLKRQRARSRYNKIVPNHTDWYDNLFRATGFIEHYPLHSMILEANQDLNFHFDQANRDYLEMINRPMIEYENITPLHLAASLSNVRYVIDLLLRGANPFLVTISGDNCLDYGKSAQNRIMRKFWGDFLKELSSGTDIVIKFSG